MWEWPYPLLTAELPGSDNYLLAIIVFIHLVIGELVEGKGARSAPTISGSL